MAKNILMCRPDFFDIEYEINPWMHTDNQVQPDEAGRQWQSLYDIYTQQLGWEVKLVDPVQGLPDMVFTANGGLLRGSKVVLPNFRQPDRQPETEAFETWFRGNGFTEFYKPKYDFEGEGDALFFNDILFSGFPWRSDKPSHREVGDFLGVRAVSLQLTDPRFYHLDTALTIVSNDTVALYPPAFTPASIQSVLEIVPNVIEANYGDAMAYGLNAMSDGHNIVIPQGAENLVGEYRNRGMNVITTPITEFQKSGGGVKCLTLQLS